MFGAISIFSLGVLGLVACTTTPSGTPSGDPPDPPTGEMGLEIRHSGAAVAGSSFQCTGNWPSASTPCGYAWSSQPQTLAISDGAGKVRLVLRRSPMPVDGGASTVTIDLSFDASGKPTATAQESTTSPPLGKEVETSTPISGWIDPVAMSAAADAPGRHVLAHLRVGHDQRHVRHRAGAVAAGRAGPRQQFRIASVSVEVVQL